MHGAGLVPVQLLGKENSKSWVRIIFFSLNLVFKCGSFRIFCWDSYREAPVYTLGSGNTDNWEEARFLSLDEYYPGRRIFRRIFLWCCLDSHVCHRWFLVAEFSIAGGDLHVAHALLALDVATPVELALAPDHEDGEDNGDDDDDNQSWALFSSSRIYCSIDCNQFFRLSIVISEN